MDDPLSLIGPGSLVLVGQGTAEPRALTRALLRRRHEIPGLRLFLGAVFSDSFTAEATDGIAFSSYGAIGGAAALAAAGRLDILPVPYSRLPALFSEDRRPDVVLLSLARSTSGLSFGPVNDYVAAAARHARMVIAEINAQMPWTHGSEVSPDLRIDHVVECDEMPVELQAAPIGEAERRIGALVASLIPDRATIQIGIGAIPDAILAALGGHRDLGFHSGMISDRVVDLIEAGVVTNAHKSFDRGITVAGALFGTRRLNRFADRNAAIRVVPTSHSHGGSTLARLVNFRAINSAIEVDLSGQVNAEEVKGRYVGAVGGQPDFVHGAFAATGGRSMIALPSTAMGGETSRIVAALSGPTTNSRCDADAVVTDWGIAELRGKTLRERADAMIAIADPKFREGLERAAHGILRAS
ncbi:MAG TPA: acetyl-CoA hydrolase/transferase C-terminal domain-containing protein [Xanthobacteraceae bacterium]|nr:acetyl-CoA hydrolase/transferase C-terminal domain-containing protein [Xanthobacteraceae bacterium]